MKLLPLIAALSCAALLSACGKPEAPATEAAAPTTQTAQAPTTAPTAAPAEAPAAAENAAGESAYKKTCAMCHSSGVAGAPKVGDAADWGPRIAQGKDTLYKHAIEGFNGAKGSMPAKGGNPAMSDDDVKAAVDFMASKSS